MIKIVAPSIIIGIDYGAKLAGTTSIAIADKKQSIKILSTTKGIDADKFITGHLVNYSNAIVCIDAPLSLPVVYINPEIGNDYFYRKSDKLLQAMSPMFLGGLTARAMQLKASNNHLPFFEVYPAALARELDLTTMSYKKEKTAIKSVVKTLIKTFNLVCTHEFISWHEVDALIALCVGLRIKSNKAVNYGEKHEVIIWV
jgi:predicted nuclease with RNAse H fold